MGGTAHVVLVEPPPGALRYAADRLRRLEERWSRFLPASEISELNDRAGQPVAVSDDTLRLMSSAVEGWRTTGGAFDPTVGSALHALGYDRTFAEVLARSGPVRPASPSPPPHHPAPGCEAIVIDPVNHTVTLPAGCRFDPGGIGKGLAADIVTAELMALGTAGACVNVGGDVRVRGLAPTPQGWHLGIEDPFDPSLPLAGLVADDTGLATSSRLVRRWSDRHHLVDPRSGTPTTGSLAAVSVLAPTATTAETLTKAAFVAGVDDIAGVLAAAGAAALFVHLDGRVSSSPAWPAGGRF